MSSLATPTLAPTAQPVARRASVALAAMLTCMPHALMAQAVDPAAPSPPTAAPQATTPQTTTSQAATPEAATPLAAPAPQNAPAASPAPQAEPAATTPPEQAATAQATTTQPAADHGAIVVKGSIYAKQDPLRHVNERSYAAIQTSDKYVVGPAAGIYTRGVPSPVRRGLHNAIYNLREPSNFAGFLLEHKFGKAGETLARFTINSTVGLAGLIDVAKSKPIHLPYRPNGLADAAGFYGIKSGPYFFLPLIGPTTLRDVIGTTIDRSWFAVAVGGPLDTFAYGAGVTIIGGLDDRSAIAGQLEDFRQKSGDPYRASRDFYLRRRQAEIDALRHPNKNKD